MSLALDLLKSACKIEKLEKLLSISKSSCDRAKKAIMESELTGAEKSETRLSEYEDILHSLSQVEAVLVYAESVVSRYYSPENHEALLQLQRLFLC